MVSVLVLAVLVNVLAALVLVGWLWGSGRLSGERLRHAAAVFAPTIAQEHVRQDQQQGRARQQEAAAREQARQEHIAQGPTPPQIRTENQARDEQLSDLAAGRFARERDDLQRQLKLIEQRLGQERTALTAERQAFDQMVAAEARQRDDRDFQKALELYQQLSPKQVKAIFANLLQQNHMPQVVEYLAAMSPRKAAAILGEFKADEVVQATALMQALRERGATALALHPAGMAPAASPAGATGGATTP